MAAMVRLRVIHTGSEGNCYLLESGGRSLLVECGVPLGEISKALKYDWSKVDGCLVTHRHGDHMNVKTARQIRNRGVEIYAMEGIFEGMRAYEGAGIVREKTLRVRFGMGGWDATLYRVPHGECPNAAALLFAPSGETLLFATDLSRLPYVFKGVNYLLLECNYSEDVRMERTMDNETVRSQSRCHMELEEAKKVVSAHLSDALRHVVLLHPSRKLLDCRVAKSEIRGVLRDAGASAPVDVAVKGLVAEMSMYPF